MSTKNKKTSKIKAWKGDPNIKVGIVTSNWNSEITDSLLSSCKETLLEAGLKAENIFECSVPGAFEIPLALKWLNSKSNPDALIGLGCVVKGETRHDEYINRSVSSALMSMGLSYNKPVIFGVLTTEDQQQAVDRSGGKYGNKGAESAFTALQMLELQSKNDQEKKSIGFN